MQDIEEMLKDYYQKQKTIERLKIKYDRLSGNIEEIKQCISNTRHTLEITLPSTSYDMERVSTSSTKKSVQEEALIRSEQRMEQRIHDFQREQSECLLERYELEGECEEIGKSLLALEDDEQMICELRYNRRRSLAYIGDEVNADRTTVSRRLKTIHEKITQKLGMTA